jgi:Co/Zn/Cd efflux system component
MAHTRHIISYCLSLREGDRGSAVTLVGLSANALLTGAKGAAGWYMNSAALLADAGHSLKGKHALPTSCPFS